MENAHICMQGYKIIKTLQAFNSTAAELKKERGCQKPHCSVASNVFRPSSVGDPVCL